MLRLIGHHSTTNLRNKVFLQIAVARIFRRHNFIQTTQIVGMVVLCGVIQGRDAILMFKSLYEKIVSQISAADIEADTRDAAVRLATAVLMVDVALVDSSFDETEFDRMLDLIKRQFGLGTQEAADLINAANAKADEHVPTQELTELLNEHLDQDEKARVVQLLWSIAYSDGQLDKYEDSLVLKVSKLLGVGSEQVERIKHETDSAAQETQH